MSKALLIVDIQNDYFEGGSNPLTGPKQAARNAAKLQTHFLQKGDPVIVIRHDAGPESSFFKTGSEGAEVNEMIDTKQCKVITKKHPNSFLETKLSEELGKLGVKQLTITGMMTHMCIDATVRAASDLGYDCTVIADACATKTLEMQGRTVSAPDVQMAFLAALASAYAAVKNTDEYLEEENIGQALA
jgi:nicotinamidase-related amidase